MEHRTSPLVPSRWPAIKFFLGSTVCLVIGYGLLSGGWQAGEAVLTIVGGAFTLGGLFMVPMSLYSVLSGKNRGGYGDCPVCGTKLEASSGDKKNLLCSGCGTYLDAAIDHFTTIGEDRIFDAPFFAAPTPWPDIRVVLSSNIAFSAFDFAQDKLTELMMKKSGNRELNARWPAAAGSAERPQCAPIP